MKNRRLVPIQANAKLVMQLKIIAACRNKKLYELVDDALTIWMRSQQKDLEEIQQLMEEE